MRKLINTILSFFKKKPAPVVPDKLDPIPSKAKFTEPHFVRVKGVKTPQRGTYKTKSGKFSGLVVHFTVSGRTKQAAINVLKYLVNHKDRLCCMVMDEDGVIYIPEDFDVFKSQGAHAGKSKWNGYSGLNRYFAGMEICNWGQYLGDDTRVVTQKEGYIVAGRYQKFTKKQEESLSNFILWAEHFNEEFSLNNVCGHDEARAVYGLPGDKPDPGGSLSMSMPKFREYLKSLL